MKELNTRLGCFAPYSFIAMTKLLSPTHSVLLKVAGIPLVVAATAFSQFADASSTFRPGHLLVKPKPGMEADAELYHALSGNTVVDTYDFAGGAQLVKILPGNDTIEMCIELEKTAQFEYVELDHVASISLEPNDPSYIREDLWGLDNTGQFGGQFDADIDAPEAWDKRHDASSVVVAVLDSGTRYTHEDLRDNLWVNPGEIAGNGIDDDGNGYVDDVYGINTINDSGDPWDDLGHGTHVAGTIGAVGANGVGITGVAWNVQLMSLKFLNENDSGSYSDAIQGIEYAIQMGADVINNSWSGTGNSFALRDAVQATEDAGVLFVSAAANQSNNLDELPEYPAAYKYSNTLAVAATTRYDSLASYSNYSESLVELAAPGSEILSTFYGSDSDYISYNGTSMATPHVAGAMALLKAEYPLDTPEGIIARLITTTDYVPALQGKVATAGRLNLNSALNVENAVAYTKAPPKSYSATGRPVEVGVAYVADQDVDIRVELFDENWNWVAGPKIEVGAGAGKLELDIVIPETAAPGSNYRWKLDIRPRGADWQAAFDDDYMVNVEIVNAKIEERVVFNAWEFDEGEEINSWEGGIGNYSAGRYVRFDDQNYLGVYNTFEVTLSSPVNGSILFYIDSRYGRKVAEVPYQSTGGWSNYQTFKVGMPITRDYLGTDFYFIMNNGVANVQSFALSQEGPSPLAINAWEYSSSFGIQSWNGGVGYFDPDDYISFGGIDLNAGYRTATVRLSSAGNYRFELRAGSQYGQVIGELAGESTGGWGVSQDIEIDLDLQYFTYGQQLYLVAKSGAANIETIILK